MFCTDIIYLLCRQIVCFCIHHIGNIPPPCFSISTLFVLSSCYPVHDNSTEDGPSVARNVCVINGSVGIGGIFIRKNQEENTIVICRHPNCQIRYKAALSTN